MLEFLSRFFTSYGVPHGYCIAWEPKLLWTMVIGNGLVALAYFSIPLALYRFVRLQRGLPFGWILVLFSAFILFCGLGHVINIVNLWYPLYRLEGVVMALTAGMSVATAAVLFPLVPKASSFLDFNRAQDRELHRLNAVLQRTSDQLRARNQALEISERRFRQTLESAPIGLAIVNLEGRWLEVNQALCAIFGYSAEELQRKTFQELTHPDDLQADLDLVQELLDGRRTTYRMMKRYLNRDGAVLTAQLDVTLVRDAEGRPLHFVSQIQDVTDRLQMEANLRAREAQARSLGELDGMLQLCQGLPELGPPVAEACAALYPGCSGALYVRNASQTWMESLHQWGAPEISEPVFAPDDCWALRNGHKTWAWLDQPHRHRCSHVGDAVEPGSASLCMPMMAQGSVIGLLHLQLPPASGLDAAASMERFAASAERIASRVGAAIANLQLRESLRNQSIRDPLTGLYNRRHLQESLLRDLARAERDGGALALLMVDIDHFKRFNDEHGHAMGDLALKRVAHALDVFCRRGDLACRYGGEEFTVVMTAVDESQALRRAENLRELIGRIRLEGRGADGLTVTVSVGVSVFPTHGHSVEALIEAADHALYAAKREGRNRVVSASGTTPPTQPPSEPPQDIV